MSQTNKPTKSAIRDSFDLVRTWEDPDGYGFKLNLYDTYQTSYGKSRLAYRFYHGDKIVFEGDDFFSSPSHAIDADATVAGLLHFLSLKPGDTDREYFEGYTEEQLAFANEWGETLSLYVEELEDR
jgi:hypothetical protein